MTRNPLYVVILVTADLVESADNFLYRQGYGRGNFSHPLIATNDPDNATPKGYACLVHADVHFRTVVANKVKEIGNKAKIFWSLKRKSAIQQGLDFIHSKGYRLKP